MGYRHDKEWHRSIKEQQLTDDMRQGRKRECSCGVQALKRKEDGGNEILIGDIVPYDEIARIVQTIV